ncbi:hypothetical protein C818_00065 [Lachnospiraceae bacterium MD308]|nr:hypothetical protein C818_00065 [Lachnospiraceae bacterium MD308]
MQGRAVRVVSQAIRYIEEHLHEKMDLDMVASALHYSKYHLHRIFTKTVGLTVHDYAKRRQLTEAAKLLVFSEKPIIEIAIMSGYESQQAFTDIFKAMYKTSPAQFREMENFYPLQLEIKLEGELVKTDLTKEDIKFATPADVEDWMELVSLTIDGYPRLDKESYTANLHQYIADKRALILRDVCLTVGVMGFSKGKGSIDFLAVHPQYRHLGITKLFVDKLADELLCGKEITLTTYRVGDKADTGYREEYLRLGFAERELLVEYGYPTQRFVLLPKNKK